ncbi:serine/threonine-protein kinase [Kribbella sp. CA-253562]|uniref:serine/threonine-protein kinase n=1 Tax=Kribbella sp. CA-253562 TaxID=3239942 RepID=UPI003D8A08F9
MGVPSRLGRYVVRRRLGSGGFATVWLAHDEQLDAEVAVKVLAENWAHDDAVRRRFLEEGRFLRRVESEHVVQVHDVGELEDGRPFLVLTYADRGTLADRLKKEPLALGNAVNVVVQVGRGLQALHRRGLLHRDVKPANVLFRSTDEGERAVLSDLGLGKSLDEVSRITMPGGTPSYVAPEQAMGERLDERADQYSLGAVAYAALTGRSPHQVDGLGAAGRVHAPAPPSSLGFAIPDKIDEAIVRALDPDRANRWPDVAAFTRELVGALDETTHGFVPQSVAGHATQQVSVDRPAVDSPTERPPSEAPTELPSAEAVTAPVAVGADPEPTAPSDANAPTLLKPGEEAGSDAGAAKTQSPRADSVQTSGESSAGASPGTGAASIAPLASIAAPANDAAASGKPAKTGRRRGRWMIAAVLALLLGGAAGFSYQRYVEPRTMGELPAHSTVQRN